MFRYLQSSMDLAMNWGDPTQSAQGYLFIVGKGPLPPGASSDPEVLKERQEQLAKIADTSMHFLKFVMMSCFWTYFLLITHKGLGMRLTGNCKSCHTWFFLPLLLVLMTWYRLLSALIGWDQITYRLSQTGWRGHESSLVDCASELLYASKIISACGTPVTIKDSNGLSCPLGIGRLARHSGLRDLLYHDLSMAYLPDTKGPPGYIQIRK